jgi:nucleoid-associated protein YgaU
VTIARYLGSGTTASVSGGSQALGRLKIFHETSAASGFVGEISALFNPNRLTFTGQAPVESRVASAARLDTAGVELTDFDFQPTTLQISLMFDTSEAKAGAYQSSRDAINVLEHTTQIVALMRPMAKATRPPRCVLRWGRYQLLQGVLTQLSQEFTRFMPDGTPVRATLQCTFTEDDDNPRRLKGAGMLGLSRLYIVRLGDTLQTISARQYGTPMRWREIALANGIENPRLLIPGFILSLPPK